RALELDDTTVTVADIDWARFGQTFTVTRPSPLISDLSGNGRYGEMEQEPVSGAVSDELAQQLAGLDPDEREKILVALVRTHAAAVLGHSDTEAIGAERPFSEAGFDSLLAVEFRDRLAGATGLNLPATLVFDRPTPVALAQRLLEELGEGETAANALSLNADIDRMASAVSAVELTDAERGHMKERLRELISALDGRDLSTGREGFTGDLETASPDELLDFLDGELGEL
ncbi:MULTISPECIES: phosphopantetheine-binding protein, partial [unclassified Streptomyces]